MTISPTPPLALNHFKLKQIQKNRSAKYAAILSSFPVPNNPDPISSNPVCIDPYQTISLQWNFKNIKNH